MFYSPFFHSLIAKLQGSEAESIFCTWGHADPEQAAAVQSEWLGWRHCQAELSLGAQGQHVLWPRHHRQCRQVAQKQRQESYNHLSIPPRGGRRLYRLPIARGPGEGSSVTRCNSGFLREAELEDLPPCPRPGRVGVSYRTYWV